MLFCPNIINKITIYTLYLSIVIFLYIVVAEIIFLEDTLDLVEATQFGINASELKVDNHLKIPTNISIIPESIKKGNLYLSSIISNNSIDYTRNFDDELFPFQFDRWYQLVELVPNYPSSEIGSSNITIDKLIIGQIKDFDGFDDLLNHTKIYRNISTNSTIILDVPHKDISFMEAEIKGPSGESIIYYGLYDGNQQSDKSEINLLINPESNLRIIKPDELTDIKKNDPLYNVTFTMVCHDIYKLGYDKCN